MPMEFYHNMWYEQQVCVRRTDKQCAVTIQHPKNVEKIKENRY